MLALVVGEDLPQQVRDATGRRTRFDLCRRVVAAEVRQDVWLMPMLPPAPRQIMKALEVGHLQAVAVGVCQAVAKAEATR